MRIKHCTMGVDDAVQAVNLIQPKLVIPAHYNAPLHDILLNPKLFQC